MSETPENNETYKAMTLGDMPVRWIGFALLLAVVLFLLYVGITAKIEDDRQARQKMMESYCRLLPDDPECV